jgi:hypothetical protein
MAQRVGRDGGEVGERRAWHRLPSRRETQYRTYVRPCRP